MSNKDIQPIANPTVTVSDEPQMKSRVPAIQIDRNLPLTKCPTNIDLTTHSGKAMAFAATSPGDLDFDKNGECRLLATHYLVFPDSGIDPETGEQREFARVVLYDKNGGTYRTTAAHGPKRIQTLLELFTPEDWAKGVPMLIKQRRSPKTGRTYHDMRVQADLLD